MNKFGLELLKYLPHPSNGTRVVNVIDNHGLFDKKKGVTFGNKISLKHYDSYDDDSFIAYWFRHALHKQQRNARTLQLQSLPRARTSNRLGHRHQKYHRKTIRLQVLQEMMETILLPKAPKQTLLHQLGPPKLSTANVYD